MISKKIIDKNNYTYSIYQYKLYMRGNGAGPRLVCKTGEMVCTRSHGGFDSHYPSPVIYLGLRIDLL